MENQEKKNELVVLPSEIQVMANQVSKEKRSELITLLDQIFSGTDEMLNAVKSIEIKDENDIENIKLADSYRKEAKARKVSSNKAFDERRKTVQDEMSDFVILDKLLLKTKQIAEIKLKQIEDAAEWKANTPIRLEMERKEKALQERLLRVEKFGAKMSDFISMTDEVFELYATGLQKTYNDKIEQQEKERLERIAKEEAIRIENEKLKEAAKIREQEIAEERRIQQEKYQLEIAEREKANKIRMQEIEAERKKQQEIIAEQNRLREIAEKELQAKRKKEVEEEANRKQIEDKAKKEADKLLKAPIKKQAHIWVESFAIDETKLNHQVIDNIKEKFLAFKKWSREQIELI